MIIFLTKLITKVMNLLFLLDQPAGRRRARYAR